jgi:hypothetical protein
LFKKIATEHKLTHVQADRSTEVRILACMHSFTNACARKKGPDLERQQEEFTCTNLHREEHDLRRAAERGDGDLDAGVEPERAHGDHDAVHLPRARRGASSRAGP